MRNCSLVESLRKVRRGLFLLSFTGVCAASTAYGQVAANESQGQINTDRVFQQTESSLIQQVGLLSSDCCAPPACADANACGDGCGATGDACADNCDWCNLGDAWTLQSLFDDPCACEESPVTFGGWTQFGYTNNSTGLFNSHPHRLNLHQFWLYAEKVADGSNGLDWGFRADLMYGVDAADTQAFGNNPGEFDFANGWDHGIYGWAMPQLYAELASGDWSVKAGHFYTLVGYEVVTAPDNFFFSHAFTMYNSEPFTHTGVLATYSGMEDVEVYAGWTLGWDTGFDQNDGGSNFLGGASLTLTDDMTLTYITTIGDFGWREEGYSHSFVFDYTVTEKLNYVFQSDFIDTNVPGDHQVGINQYLLYSMNDCLAVGGRLEWWKTGGDSAHSITAGLNYRPHANIVVRPEIRYQWSPTDTFTANTGIPMDEWIFGFDTIFTF